MDKSSKIYQTCEIVVQSYKFAFGKTECICKIVGKQDSEKLLITIPKDQFGFDAMDGELYALAFLTSYINKNQNRVKYSSSMESNIHPAFSGLFETLANITNPHKNKAA